MSNSGAEATQVRLWIFGIIALLVLPAVPVRATQLVVTELFPPYESWFNQVVYEDSHVDFGGGLAAGYDHQGRLMLDFAANERAVVATEVNGSWSFLRSPVGGGAFDGAFSPIDGSPALVVGSGLHQMTYEKYQNGTWTLYNWTVVSASGRVIALAQDGTPNIVYGSFTGMDYATLTPTGMVVEQVVVDPDVDIVDAAGIAVDSHGVTHIAFVWSGKDNGVSSVYYATRLGPNNWEIHDLRIRCASMLRLAIGTNDIPQFVCHDSAGLLYATTVNGQWQATLVDSRNGGFDSRIVLDRNNTPHVSYTKLGAGTDFGSLADPVAAMYATLTPAPFGWVIESVDPANQGAGPRTAITVDAAGVPRVAYTSSGTGEPAPYDTTDTFRMAEPMIVAQPNEFLGQAQHFASFALTHRLP